MTVHAAKLLRSDYKSAKQKTCANDGTLALSRYIRKIGISRSTFYNWERGISRIAFDTACLIETNTGGRLRATDLLQMDDLNDNKDDDPENLILVPSRNQRTNP